MYSLGLIVLVTVIVAQSAPAFFEDYKSTVWENILPNWPSATALKNLRTYGLSNCICPYPGKNFFVRNRLRFTRKVNSTRAKRSIGCGSMCRCCSQPICVSRPQPVCCCDRPACCCSQPGCSYGTPSTSCCKIQLPPTCYTVQPPPQCILLQPPPIPIMVQPPPITCRVQSPPMCLQIQSQPLCCCSQPQQPSCNCCQHSGCKCQPSCCRNRKRRSLPVFPSKIMEKTVVDTRSIGSRGINDKVNGTLKRERGLW